MILQNVFPLPLPPRNCHQMPENRIFPRRLSRLKLKYQFLDDLPVNLDLRITTVSELLWPLSLSCLAPGLWPALWGFSGRGRGANQKGHQRGQKINNSHQVSLVFVVSQQVCKKKNCTGILCCESESIEFPNYLDPTDPDLQKSWRVFIRVAGAFGAGVFGWSRSRNCHPAPAPTPTPTLQYF